MPSPARHFVRCCLALLLLATPVRAEPLRAGGTGAATGLIAQLGRMMAGGERGLIDVIPGLGSSGGIAAVADGALDLAVSGRPLREDERSRGVTQILLGRTPFVLATSSAKPASLRHDAVAAFFSNPEARWADGRTVRVILRPRNDSDYTQLANSFPGMRDALEAIRARPDVPLAATDQDNLDMAERIEGSLVGACLTQIVTERRRLSLVPIDGVEPNFAAFADGRYTIGKDIYLVYRAAALDRVAGLLDFLGSPEGRAALRAAALLSGP